MDEFSLIDCFFKKDLSGRPDIIFGIGDDAACLQVPPHHQLLVSTDTLVAGVHFLACWDPYDIAWKAVMVNASDIVAMAGKPCWVSLALTIPELNESWLSRFSEGLHKALARYQIALIGGDTTRGPLSITLTIHGIVPNNKSVRRNGAEGGDSIWVSGKLGAAALAVSFLGYENTLPAEDLSVMMDKLLHPEPRFDLMPFLQSYASAAIDISDGLSADLNHICQASGLGACLISSAIPIHELVFKYQNHHSVHFALSGGDDYELCFTIPQKNKSAFIEELRKSQINCYEIGKMENQSGLRLQLSDNQIQGINAYGYNHFKEPS